MELTKTIARSFLKRDWIPKGQTINFRRVCLAFKDKEEMYYFFIGKIEKEEPPIFIFRETEESEVLRCCCSSHADWPQSGPIFCGEIADYVAETYTGFVAVCCKCLKKIPHMLVVREIPKTE